MNFLLDIFSSQIFWIIAWVVVFIVTLIIEIIIPGLVSIWFSGGALVAFILALFNINPIIQIVVFVGVSGVLLILTKFVFKKSFFRKETTPTNADSLIGKEILITKGFNKDTQGEGKIRDIIWNLTTTENVSFKSGELAIIKDVEGSHIIVVKKEGK